MRNHRNTYKTQVKNVSPHDDDMYFLTTDDQQVLQCYEQLFLTKEPEDIVGRRVKIVTDAQNNILEVLDLNRKKMLYKYNPKIIDRIYGLSPKGIKLVDEVREGVKNLFYFKAKEAEKDSYLQAHYQDMRIKIPYNLQLYRDINQYGDKLRIEDMADIVRYYGIWELIRQGFSDFVLPEARELAKYYYRAYLKLGKDIEYINDGYRSFDEFLHDVEASAEYFTSEDDEFGDEDE